MMTQEVVKGSWLGGCVCTDGTGAKVHGSTTWNRGSLCPRLCVRFKRDHTKKHRPALEGASEPEAGGMGGGY